ncbi:ComEA family DNA-binding protein [Dietzia maris]|jgi:competence protein ComEA|uniref:ComEA family DNA-binding protein n=1 Tax=Dietzia TaxID=37914 RepID=UPI0022B34AF7|nr:MULTISPECIES: ComEA family DNA-binding protein [Dietzia]MCZ4655675.1 ComEA family DNA-binding protein [Dietzia kunjamensis]MDV3355998.1 ComEA family DNA-binding protein [Dietzia sp. IN118]
MRTETPARSGGPVDSHRDPARAAALHRLASALSPPVPDRPTSVPWADLDPAGDRPERIPPQYPDAAAWADPPWWGRIRWAPDRLAGIALVMLVLGLGAFSVHRLISSVPEGPAVPDLPLAQVGEPVADPADPADAATDEGGASTRPAPPSPGSGSGEAGTAGEPLVVSVVGLVGRSGLVTLAPGARVADALDSAGGVLEGGDRDGLNLARKVSDGEQILVGSAPGPDGSGGPRSDIIGPGPGPGPGSGAGPGTAGTGAPAGGPTDPGGGGGLIDLNTADAAALESLPGVGPVTASSILAWRAANGSFSGVDQLVEVDGIGPATLARLRPLVTV